MRNAAAQAAKAAGFLAAIDKAAPGLLDRQFGRAAGAGSGSARDVLSRLFTPQNLGRARLIDDLIKAGISPTEAALEAQRIEDHESVDPGFSMTAPTQDVDPGIRNPELPGPSESTGIPLSKPNIGELVPIGDGDGGGDDSPPDTSASPDRDTGTNDTGQPSRGDSLDGEAGASDDPDGGEGIQESEMALPPIPDDPEIAKAIEDTSEELRDALLPLQQQIAKALVESTERPPRPITDGAGAGSDDTPEDFQRLEAQAEARAFERRIDRVRMETLPGDVGPGNAALLEEDIRHLQLPEGLAVIAAASPVGTVAQLLGGLIVATEAAGKGDAKGVVLGLGAAVGEAALSAAKLRPVKALLNTIAKKGGERLAGNLGRVVPEVAAKWLGDKLGGAGTLAAKSARGAVKRALDGGQDMRTAFIAGAAAATAATARKSLKDGALRRLGLKTFEELSPARRARFKSVARNEVTKALAGLAQKKGRRFWRRRPGTARLCRCRYFVHGAGGCESRSVHCWFLSSMM